MSLLSAAMTACVRLVRTVERDGRGGSVITWTDTSGDEFNAAIWKKEDRTTETGEKPADVGTYAILASGVVLNFHDVIKRKSDDKTFRVTAEGTDSAPPASASGALGVVSCNVMAEEWEIPTGGEDEHDD